MYRILLFILALSLTSKSHSQNFDYNIMLGQAMFDFQGKTLKNESFKLSDYKGKNIMLVFWSKSCGGCNKELPDLNLIKEEFKSENFVLLSVMDESIEELTNNDTTQYSLRIRNHPEGFYKYNRPIYRNQRINFEIVTEGIKIRDKIGLPHSSPITLFIDEDFIIRDYERAYYLYADNHQKLKDKLLAVLSK